MKVVYLFCGSATVRIPFFGHGRRLFDVLAAEGGVWDNTRHQFVFIGITNAGHFSQIISGVPWVWVEENTAIPARVFGFFERPWDETVGSKQPAKILHQISLPDQFSKQWEIRLETELRSRKYSKRTQRLYLFFNRLLCKTLQKPPEEINPEDIPRFLAFIEKEREYSASSINLAISSIKFFYKRVLKRDIVGEQRRPRHDKKLPMVLSKTEINKILNLENNIKHRLLLTLVYSSGLRVSEVVSLKKEHIDLSRGILYIKLGKGRKDRCTILSKKAASLVAQYLANTNIHSWLFPGQQASRPLSIRSAQKIFDKASRHTEIHKEVSIHSLRHTFATHLLENGTDIRYIQALLGHSSLRTTERYTHIAKGSILNVQSPLDTIL